MSSHRGQLSLNGGKKKNHYASASQQQFNARSAQSSKLEKNGNGHKVSDEVIVIDEDDIPLAKQILLDQETVKIKSPEKNGSEATDYKTAKQALPEEVTPVILTERESTPKRNKSRSNEKSPRSEKKVEIEEVSVVEPSVEEVAIIYTGLPEDNSFDEKKEAKQTKVVTLTADVLSSANFGSTRRSDRLVNASTIVNLSTVSDQSERSKTADETSETNYNVSSNKVSGRRSTRPIKDICFTYRSNSPNASLDSSVNATVGSEIHNSCLATPSLKRQIGSTESIDSSKRARLDFSGFFSSLSSPVTLLRNKFRNAQIQSSTPNREDEFQEVPLYMSTEPTEDNILENISAAGEIKDATVTVEVVQQAPENPKSRCAIM